MLLESRPAARVERGCVSEPHATQHPQYPQSLSRPQRHRSFHRHVRWKAWPPPLRPCRRLHRPIWKRQLPPQCLRLLRCSRSTILLCLPPAVLCFCRCRRSRSRQTMLTRARLHLITSSLLLRGLPRGRLWRCRPPIRRRHRRRRPPARRARSRRRSRCLRSCRCPRLDPAALEAVVQQQHPIASRSRRLGTLRAWIRRSRAKTDHKTTRSDACATKGVSPD